MFQRKLALVSVSTSLPPSLSLCAAFALIFMTRDERNSTDRYECVCIYICSTTDCKFCHTLSARNPRGHFSLSLSLSPGALGSLSAGLHLDLSWVASTCPSSTVLQLLSGVSDDDNDGDHHHHRGPRRHLMMMAWATPWLMLFSA